MKQNHLLEGTNVTRVSVIFKRSLAALSALALAVAALVSSSAPAQAVATPNLYWIAYDSIWNTQLYSASAGTNPIVPSGLLTNTVPANNPDRGVATDGSHLFFSDNSSSQLVRTNLDGSGRVVVANISASADAITVANGNVYWSQWSDGILGVSATATNATPTVVVAAGSNNTAWYGFSSVAVSGSDLFFGINDGSNPASFTPGVGLWHATLSGLTASSVTKNADVAGWMEMSVGSGVATDGTSVYIASAGGSRRGVVKSSTWSQAFANWTAYDTTLITASPAGLAIYGTTIFISSASGQVLKMSTSGVGTTQIFDGTGTNMGFQIAAGAPPSKTVTFDANGGTGTMAAQSASSATALTSNAFTRINARFAFWNDTTNCASPGTLYNNGASYSFSADITLYACWVGAIDYSLTSSGAAVTGIDFGAVAIGSSSTIDVWVRNLGVAGTGMRSSNFSNSSTVGSYLTAAGTGSTCPSFTGGTLGLGASCKIVVTFAPSAAVTSLNGYVTIQYGGGTYTFSVAGSAVAARVVTFNANGGTGTLANQSSTTTANLTANTNGITRSGYTFAGWNTSANGSGTAFTDAGSYNFSNSITLYAQWTAVPVSSSGGSIDSTEVRIGGISTKVVDPTTPAITVTGFNLEKVTSVQVNGVDVKFTASGSSISIALVGLNAGTSPSITISGNGFKIQLLGAFRVVEKVATSTGNGNGNGGTQVYSQSFSVFFAPGSSALTATGKAALAANLGSVKRAVSGVVVTGWTQDTGNNKGDAALANNRAKAIVAWFKAKGISALTAIAKGTETTAAKSRRADIAYATK